MVSPDSLPMSIPELGHTVAGQFPPADFIS